MIHTTILGLTASVLTLALSGLACSSAEAEAEAGSAVDHLTGGPARIVDVQLSRNMTCARTDAGVVHCYRFTPNDWLSDAQEQSRYATHRGDNGQVCLDGTFRCEKAPLDTALPTSHHWLPYSGDEREVCLNVDGIIRCAFAVVDGWGKFFGFNVTTPIEYSSTIAVARARAGGFYSLGADGSVRFKGRNRELPTIDIAGHTLKTLVGNGRHACGIAANGDLFCWGDNDAGQLGLPDRRNRDPELTTGGDDADLSKLPRVALGDGVIAEEVALSVGRTCALLSTREVRCWGSGPAAPLWTKPSVRPVPTGTFVHVFSGAQSICGALADGHVTCWGTIDPQGPLQAFRQGDVDFGSPVVKFASTTYQACVVLASGALKCWDAGDRQAETPSKLRDLPPVDLR